MDRGSTVIIALATGIAGIGLGIAVGFVAAVVFLGSDTIAALGAGTEGYEEHFDVTVLASEVRPQGVYVRFENTGDRMVDDLTFELEVRDVEGRLIDEHQVNLMQQIPPGRIEETILTAYTMEGEAVELDGHQVAVTYAYGWSTVR